MKFCLTFFQMINCCIEKKRHREGLSTKVDHCKQEIDKTSDKDDDEVRNVSISLMIVYEQPCFSAVLQLSISLAKNL